jgi:hypothetical protein
MPAKPDKAPTMTMMRPRGGRIITMPAARVKKRLSDSGVFTSVINFEG